LGVSYGKPVVDLAKLKAHKNKVVGKLTGGLAAMAKMRKVTVVRGLGEFMDPYHLQVEETTGDGQEKTGKKQTIKFRNAIIAAGSQAMHLPFMPKDPRVVDSTGALELGGSPKRMLILGGGIIGLEMGTVYSTLGARLDVVEMLDGLMQGADRDLVKVWQKMNAPRFDNIMLKTKTVGAEATKDGILVRFEGEQAPKDPQVYDLVLQAVGRSPNGKKIGARRPAWPSPTAASSPWTSRCAPTCRTSSPSGTSLASPCWRTRRCMRRTWRRKWRRARTRRSMPV
jgi:dihydrolipoamide dehydrogenase